VTLKNVTVTVETAPTTIDLSSWVSVYVREVFRLEGYSVARRSPSSDPPFAEAG
jgi:hypothetical protein